VIDRCYLKDESNINFHQNYFVFIFNPAEHFVNSFISIIKYLCTKSIHSLEGGVLILSATKIPVSRFISQLVFLNLSTLSGFQI